MAKLDDILDQAELDALVAAVSAGQLDPARELGRGASEAVNFDLFSSGGNKGLVPNLDLIYDGFIRFYRANISNRTRKIVELRKASTRSYKFDDFVVMLPQQVVMAIYKIEPLKGVAMLALDGELVYSIVDSVLGGTGASDEQNKSRVFTNIELKLMEKIVRDVLGDLERAWAPVLAAKLSLIRMEMNPRLVTIVPPEYQVVATTLEIEMENQARGRMIFAMPHMMIEPIREKLRSGTQFDMSAIDPQWGERLSGGLDLTPVELAVEMGRATVTMEQLVGLAPGDQILLDTDMDSSMVVKVGGVQKFVGRPGISHGNKAIKITGVCRPGGE